MKIGYLAFGLKAMVLALVSVLPQPIKIPLYRLFGYKIGKGSRIGFCSLLLCDRLEIGNYAKINPLVVICAGRLRMADYGWIGPFTFCYGRGGLLMGKFAAVGMRVLLNAERDILIDEHAFIGQYSNIYTHSVAFPYTKGYPRKFAEVTIGKSVRISARTMVMPGIGIGENTWVGPQSLVNKDLPANVFAGGVPAKIIHEDVKKMFDTVDGTEVRRRVAEMIDDFLKTRSIGISRRESDGKVIFLKTGGIAIAVGAPVPIDKTRRYILVTFGDVNIAACEKNVSWFDFSAYKARINCRLSREMRDFFWSHYGERIEIV